MRENLIPGVLTILQEVNKKTVIYGSKSDNEGMVNILVSGMNCIRKNW